MAQILLELKATELPSYFYLSFPLSWGVWRFMRQKVSMQSILPSSFGMSHVHLICLSNLFLAVGRSIAVFPSQHIVNSVTLLVIPLFLPDQIYQSSFCDETWKLPLKKSFWRVWIQLRILTNSTWRKNVLWTMRSWSHRSRALNSSQMDAWKESYERSQRI